MRHEVEVLTPANAIPEFFTVDLARAQVGDAIKISSVTLPEGVRPTITDRDFTIATIAAPGGGVQGDEAEQDAAGGDETAAGGEDAG